MKTYVLKGNDELRNHLQFPDHMIYCYIIQVTYWHFARSSSTRLRGVIFILTQGWTTSLLVEY